MDEKIKNDEKNVMLVRDAGKNGKIEAVSQIDEDGNIQTVAAASSNLANLFNVYTNDSAIEAFLKKFIEEMQAPVKTGISDIFIMPVAVLDKLFKVDVAPQLMEHYLRRNSPASNSSATKDNGFNLWTFRKSTGPTWSAREFAWRIWSRISEPCPTGTNRTA